MGLASSLLATLLKYLCSFNISLPPDVGETSGCLHMQPSRQYVKWNNHHQYESQNPGEAEVKGGGGGECNNSSGKEGKR